MENSENKEMVSCDKARGHDGPYPFQIKFDSWPFWRDQRILRLFAP